MSVFIAIFTIDYEGTLTQEVFSTRELAEAFVATQGKSFLGSWTIDEFTVDQPAS